MLDEELREGRDNRNRQREDVLLWEGLLGRCLEQPFIHHPLMRRMLVDKIQPVWPIRQDIAALRLPDELQRRQGGWHGHTTIPLVPIPTPSAPHEVCHLTRWPAAVAFWYAILMSRRGWRSRGLSPWQTRLCCGERAPTLERRTDSLDDRYEGRLKRQISMIPSTDGRSSCLRNSGHR